MLITFTITLALLRIVLAIPASDSLLVGRAAVKTLSVTETVCLIFSFLDAIVGLTFVAV